MGVLGWFGGSAGDRLVARLIGGLFGGKVKGMVGGKIGTCNNNMVASLVVRREN